MDLVSDVRNGMRTRPVRISDNALLLSYDLDLFTDVWYGLREFETELFRQRLWQLRAIRNQLIRISDLSKPRGYKIVKKSISDAELMIELRKRMDSFHNHLRNHSAYAKYKSYIPDVFSDEVIPEWDGSNYRWDWFNSCVDPDNPESDCD
jgi:hypothetical protein